MPPSQRSLATASDPRSAPSCDAYARMAQLDAGERERGVLAESAGSHVQGATLAA
jgi:hypothetical protein